MNEQKVINYSYDKQVERINRSVEKGNEQNTAYGQQLINQYAEKLFERLVFSRQRDSFKKYLSQDYDTILKYCVGSLIKVVSGISQEPSGSKVNRISVSIGDVIMQVNSQNKLETTEDKKIKIKIGRFLLEHITELGVVEILFWNDENYKKRFYYINPTEKTKELIKYNNSILIPSFLPSTEKPVEWNDIWKGDLIKIPLIRHRQEYFKNYHKLFLPLNTLQNTAYKVDNFILNTAIDLANDGIEVKGLPYDVEYDVPEYDGTPEWFHKRDYYRKQKARSVSKLYLFEQTIELAEHYRNQTIYFDHNCDSRGRMYPLANGLTPQGNDLSKALLKFNDGEKLTQRGVKWLKITIASYWGIKGQKEQLKWFKDNKNKIFDYISNPKENNGWMKADEPWCFLTSCMDFVEYSLDNNALIRGMGHLDGANNALQHYALLGRDDSLARYCGILPSLDGLDYYEICSKHLQKLCKMEDEEFNLFFGHLINERGFIKTSAMVKTYGATADQVRKSIKEQLLENKIIYNKEYVSKMVKLIQQAIEIASTIATEIMNWFVNCCEVLGENFIWSTPDEIEFSTDYNKTDTWNGDLRVDGKRIRVSLRIDLLEKNGNKIVNVDKIKLAQPANFIHSFDACHLRMMITYLVNRNIRRIAAIHDAIMVHYNDMDIAYTGARETALEIYKTDHLQRLKDEWKERYKKELPEIPKYGNLDVNCLTESEGFFAS